MALRTIMEATAMTTERKAHHQMAKINQSRESTASLDSLHKASLSTQLTHSSRSSTLQSELPSLPNKGHKTSEPALLLNKKTNKPKPNQIMVKGRSKKLKSANKNKITTVNDSSLYDEENEDSNDEFMHEINGRYEEIKSLRRPEYKTTKMTKSEALNTIQKIVNNATSLMRLCYELSARKGYLVLGYKDFKACITKELAGVISYDYAHKMKNAGEVHRVVCPDLPMGDVSESVLRPMHKLPDDDRRQVWNSCVEESADGEPIIPTARDINCTMRALGLTDNITDNDLEKAFYHVVFSPELEKKLKYNALKLIKEFLRKAPLPQLAEDPTITKDHFDKAVKLLLKKLSASISDEFEKHIASLESE